MKNRQPSFILLFIFVFCLPLVNIEAQSQTKSANSPVQTQESVNGKATAADTISNSLLKKSEAAASIAIPALMVTYGIVSLESPALQKLDYSSEHEMHEDKDELYNKVDDYMQFAPAATAFCLNAFGVKSTHRLSEMTLLYALSNILETGIVYTTKSVTPRTRPDGSANNSFPSGHTATAFVAAEFLHQEYKGQSVWISVGGYAAASLIGVSRVLNDKHWISDVVAGAGIGILSTRLVYYAYPYMKEKFHHHSTLAHSMLFPSYDRGMLCMNLAYTF